MRKDIRGVSIREGHGLKLVLPGKLLLVAETKHARWTTGSILRGMGVSEIVEAEGVFQSLEVLHSDPAISMVLSDLNIAPLDDYVLLSSLRQQTRDNLKETPFILMSSDTSIESVQKAKDAGATAMLAKPFPIRDIHKVLHRVIARHHGGATHGRINDGHHGKRETRGQERRG